MGAASKNVGKKANLLAEEKSPYLQEHKYNPVAWRPWGDEALRKAKNDGKPILLSIGYSTCHWCHVMAAESFEDEETARLINRDFVPIKVDREERPELDAYYMSAVQAMTGGGGWPLTVFLTPDLKPYYGGTYFPPVERFGMPSFRDVLEFAARVWKERKGEALATGDQVSKAIVQEDAKEVSLTKGLLDEGYTALVASFDEAHGGFGGAPKFPLPLSIGYLLRYHYRTGKEVALRAATKTLDEMLKGGIRDHVGGGFHRYSTDRVWLVPHFEKMLYDNALLSRVYLEAYQVTGRKDYADVAEEALDWISDEMSGPGGGIYSAQDADTTEGEGVYYTWTPEEVAQALGKDSGRFCQLYGVTRTGNFEGRNILHRAPGADASVRAEAEGGVRLKKARSALLKARRQRPRPKTDTKVLTSWNGLAISSLALSGSVLGRKGDLSAGVRAAEYILNTNSREGRLLRRSVGGEAALEGTLEDYAFFVQGILDLFEATSDPRWLKEAVRLAKLMVELFQDKQGAGFYITVDAGPWRRKDDYDGPTPSGNSVATLCLVRLAEFTGDARLRELAADSLKFFAAKVEENPAGHALMLTALDALLNGSKEVVVSAPDAEAAAPFVDVARKAFVPGKAVVVVTAKTFGALVPLTPLVEGRKPGKSAVGYVCENFVCKLPARSPQELERQLGATT